MDTKNLENITNMFYGCTSLTNLILDFETQNVKSMKNLFHNCESLNYLDLSSFNTTNVEDMAYMFSNCSSLNSIDLSNFSFQNVKTMTNMFNNCINFKHIKIDLNNSKVKDINYMFSYCRNLTSLDLINLISICLLYHHFIMFSKVVKI